jgi:HD-GYP domain-containing protein (c-di-GMP phosphodiesterase class II)
VNDQRTTSQTKPASASVDQPILTYEKSLSSKVAEGSEARDVLDQQVMQLGGQLVTNLHALLKISRIHDRTNAALNQSVEAILMLVKTLAQDGEVTIRSQHDFLFLGQMHLKMSSQQFTTFMEFADSLNTREIGSITFASSLKEPELREFAHLFVNLDTATDSSAELKQQMQDRNITGIEIEESKHLMIKVGEHHQQAKLLAKHNYVHAVEATGEIVESVKEGRAPNFKRAKRVIQSIVDLMMQDESFLLSLTTLRCYDQYTHNHSVNVCLLSLALANRTGFPKVALADLGLAALLHDVGKASIPLEVLNKPDEFTEAEWQLMRCHPSEGVVDMLRLRGLDQLPWRMAAASFEHHMKCDLSGYPKLVVPWKLSLTGRILMIADCYDAMTSSRVYRREPMSPEKVLNYMMAKRGESFDEVLMKLFVNCVGLLPIGSLVLLDSNELAVVLRPAQDKKETKRPVVKVITDANGKPINGSEINLAETDPGGQYKRSVVRLVDQTEYRFNTSRYFVDPVGSQSVGLEEPPTFA